MRMSGILRNALVKNVSFSIEGQELTGDEKAGRFTGNFRRKIIWCE